MVKRLPALMQLIKAGIKKVYVATLDPNPLVSGSGVKLLKREWDRCRSWTA